jgi:uncharacterized damage-inducible protein DinB
MRPEKYLRMIFVLTPMLLTNLTGINAQDSLLISSHVTKLRNAKTYTLQVAELMPNTKYGYKPVEGEMSFKEQLVHIGKNIYWLSSTYIRETDDPVKKMELDINNLTKEQVAIFLEGAYDYAVSSFQETDIKTFSKEFKWAGGKMNKIQFMNLIQDHQTHHRGQLMVYLRLNNLQPPRYIGW